MRPRYKMFLTHQRRTLPIHTSTGPPGLCLYQLSYKMPSSVQILLGICRYQINTSSLGIFSIHWVRQSEPSKSQKEGKQGDAVGQLPLIGQIQQYSYFQKQLKSGQCYFHSFLLRSVRKQESSLPRINKNPDKQWQSTVHLHLSFPLHISSATMWRKSKSRLPAKPCLLCWYRAENRLK